MWTIGEERSYGYLPFSPCYMGNSGMWDWPSILRREDWLDEVGRQMKEDEKHVHPVVMRTLHVMKRRMYESEDVIWRDFSDRRVAGTELQTRYADAMPRIADAIDARPDREQILREIYFSFVIPVIAAVDARAEDVALRLYEEGSDRLVKTWLETGKKT